ncbi:hypothetical protein A3C89_02405 [Candidatus Kaiserbacteria bacterium RIFCSPHIGHO2_02_FULL_50_50]|uniref:Peptidase M13 n=1 Tax=Candidatus Kaiserbacteria bacterium RIFCSPHIGHO2_02_FULL_50_50 TaxID=1798492 RepID=A0A1F6DD53_9BACT|nr:MAG: hypothetical protein A3C89_02405 [Candidatus Kaiserbacteria bacterium RIFCSPHIGHO2_02_FULL_50_50]OGG88202.1 MAG: hypothetical protein A3G62_00400 [Candidatus Kaiserbacteria bacterium RIFCSPLOWO2_12_FULL_50_10]
MKTYRKQNLDTSVLPQDDFFQYANGGWIAKNPIPPEKSSWGSFYALREKVAKQVHAIAKDAIAGNLVAGKHGVGDNEAQQLSDFFASGMDMKTRNKLGLTPIQHWLDLIENIDSTESLIAAITHLHNDGFSPLFGVFVGQDDKASTKYITNIVEGGITLGERDFYLVKSERNETIKAGFLAYANKLLEHSPSINGGLAQTLWDFETKLAKISMSRNDRRDITKTYHKYSVSAWQKECPAFPWKAYLTSQGLGSATHLLVQQPEYLKKMTELLAKTPLSTWKLYLRFGLLDASAGMLTGAIGTTAFEFYGKVMSGSEKQEPLWKRVLGAVNAGIPDILGKEYVRRHFSEDAKEHMDALVDDLFVAFRARIKNLDWMSDGTKKKALVKLGKMTRKIGYPTTWRMYAGLHIDGGDYVGNIMRAGRHEMHHNYGKLGKPVDHDEWFMPPHMVNAYFSPNMNEIVFPAAILQDPFFDHEGDNAINYGAIGVVIGHEMTHGFDNQGALFDGDGNYKNWWTAEDKKRFDKKAAVLVKQFNNFRVHGQRVNGKLTLGENIADLGGLAIAYDAFMNHLEKHPEENVTLGGYTPTERFFLGFAHFECGHGRKEYELMKLVVDEHAPSKSRINLPVANTPAWHQAYKTEPHHKLYLPEKKQAKIW